MPGPGHPGHFPKPPGWIDRPGGPAGGTGGPPGGTGGPTKPDPASAGPSATGHPPSSSAGPAADGQDAASSPEAGARSKAAEAAAKVAEMLHEEGEEGKEVAAAEEAIADDIEDLGSVVAARDEYLDSLRRLQADFENYKKRIQRQHADLQERAAEKLVERLLPALDNFDLALAHADEDTGFEPVYRSLLGVLETAGLERLDPAGQPFDPNEHDAVLHEEAEDSPAPEVIEVLRAGYRWKGRVLRPAMVKVKG